MIRTGVLILCFILFSTYVFADPLNIVINGNVVQNSNDSNIKNTMIIKYYDEGPFSGDVYVSFNGKIIHSFGSWAIIKNDEHNFIEYDKERHQSYYGLQRLNDQIIVECVDLMKNHIKCEQALMECKLDFMKKKGKI